MDVLIAGLLLLGCVGTLAGLLLLFLKSRRRQASYLIITSTIAIVLSVWQIGQLSDERAREAGFIDFEEQKAASEAGFETASEWNAWQARKEAEAARLERERQAETERALLQQQAEEAERRLAEERACRADIQCWGDKHLMSAAIACQKHIENLANYSFEWTDGWLEPKFSRFRWKDKDNGIITFIGDKIMFQNGFGAMEPHTYICDYHPESSSALSVSAEPGRL